VITILIAEDHRIVRESLRLFLDEVEDFKVVGEARDGEEAAALAKTLEPNVVIMDIAMEGMNGIEATKKIRADCPNTAVLVLSAYDYDQYVFALLEAGAAGYLLKDVSGHELISAIRAVCQGDSVLYPAVAGKVVKKFREKNTERGERLTDREKDVLELAAKGMKNKEIAHKLYVSVRTVEAHLGSIFNKLEVNSRTEAVLVALKRGELYMEDLNEAGI